MTLTESRERELEHEWVRALPTGIGPVPVPHRGAALLEHPPPTNAAALPPAIR